MISAQTQKVFALAMIAFAMPGNASQAQVTDSNSCDKLYSAEIRSAGNDGADTRLGFN